MVRTEGMMILCTCKQKIKEKTMETEEQRERILQGNPWKILIDFSWPAVAAMFLLGANNVY